MFEIAHAPIRLAECIPTRGRPLLQEHVPLRVAREIHRPRDSRRRADSFRVRQLFTRKPIREHASASELSEIRET